jgi:hypothetical protein
MLDRDLELVALEQNLVFHPNHLIWRRISPRLARGDCRARPFQDNLRLVLAHAPQEVVSKFIDPIKVTRTCSGSLGTHASRVANHFAGSTVDAWAMSTSSWARELSPILGADRPARASIYTNFDRDKPPASPDATPAERRRSQAYRREPADRHVD